MSLNDISLSWIEIVEILKLRGIARRHLHWEHFSIVGATSYLVIRHKNSVVFEVCLILVNCVVFKGGKSYCKLKSLFLLQWFVVSKVISMKNSR